MVSKSHRRPPCTSCGRAHSSARTEVLCKEAAGHSRSKSRTHHKSSKSRSHSRSHSRTGTGSRGKSGTDTGTGAGTRTGTGTSRSGSKQQQHHHHHHHDPESGRHPSSSLGPGLTDPVLLALLVILALSMIILFVLGIWLLAARNGWPVGLDLTGSIGWTRTISYGTACLVLALLFLPTIIFVVLDARAKRGATARQTRLFAVFLASLAFIVLVLMTFNGLFFATNGPRFIKNIIDDAWVNTVTNDNRVRDACLVQNRYNCEGWEDNSCINCRPTASGVFDNCSGAQRQICPRCWRDTRNTKRKQQQQHIFKRSAATAQLPSALLVKQTANQAIPGCRRFVLRRYREFFIPMSVYTIFLAVLLILLSWKTCIDSSGR